MNDYCYLFASRQLFCFHPSFTLCSEGLKNAPESKAFSLENFAVQARRNLDLVLSFETLQRLVWIFQIHLDSFTMR